MVIWKDGGDFKGFKGLTANIICNTINRIAYYVEIFSLVKIRFLIEKFLVEKRNKKRN